ncbi:MAG: hypothetical protein CMF38_05630 [Legionellaceae bacterium]|nr:hypothetical protein [Legionellaceae bacterium]HAF87662.1 twin transmembrane helix small protein [Legionellales bacterium]HCA88766.1 twin transmembrane helix small protein [Legionellales bacterium]|tara:strand:+ start:5525 stop:5728 length:204 start_codon:yes stop_codon:yes gene_type:complete
MLTKLIVITVMFMIIGILASGLLFLVKDKGHTNRTLKALTWRIGLSLMLFIFLFVAFSFGWIQPHAV